MRGEAANEAQKDLTTEYAKDVEGVKAVKNEMTVFNGHHGVRRKDDGRKNG